MKKVPFMGAATAVITPMKDSEIDFDGFSRIIEMQIKSGISAIVVCGTTGESPTLSSLEKAELFRCAASIAGGRTLVIAGCGSPSTKSSAELAEAAEKAGADAILTVTPYYNKCSAEGLYLHYRAVAERVELPVIAYNVPARTGVDISLDAYEKLATIENLAGVKEASGNVAKAEQIVSYFGDRFTVYSGCDDLIAPLYSVGAKGVVSVISNILPAETVELCRLLQEGDLRAAAELQVKMYPLVRALFSDVNPIPVKYAMSRLGICSSEMRLPLSPSNVKTRALIDRELEKWSLI